MVCLGFKPTTAEWLAQTKPHSYFGRPLTHNFYFERLKKLLAKQEEMATGEGTILNFRVVDNLPILPFYRVSKTWSSIHQTNQLNNEKLPPKHMSTKFRTKPRSHPGWWQVLRLVHTTLQPAKNCSDFMSLLHCCSLLQPETSLKEPLTLLISLTRCWSPEASKW